MLVFKTHDINVTGTSVITLFNNNNNSNKRNANLINYNFEEFNNNNNVSFVNEIIDQRI